MLKKALKAVLAVLVLASALCVSQPFRAWASEEGAWIFHWFWVNGPALVYTTNTWKDAAGTTHTGLEINSGKYGSAASLSERHLGAMATSARPACAAGTEGDYFYDTTVHSIAFCNGTSWYKSVDSGTAVSWTVY